MSSAIKPSLKVRLTGRFRDKGMALLVRGIGASNENMRILCAFISEQLLSGQVLDQALIEALCSQEGDEADGDRAEGC